jgi:hypothetical protein
MGWIRRGGFRGGGGAANPGHLQRGTHRRWNARSGNASRSWQLERSPVDAAWPDGISLAANHPGMCYLFNVKAGAHGRL